MSHADCIGQNRRRVSYIFDMRSCGRILPQVLWTLAPVWCQTNSPINWRAPRAGGRGAPTKQYPLRSCAGGATKPPSPCRRHLRLWRFGPQAVSLTRYVALWLCSSLGSLPAGQIDSQIYLANLSDTTPASATLRADPGDVESSRDYAGFPRLPGFIISDYDEDNPAEFDFPAARPLPDDANHVETVHVKGHRYVIRYELSPGNHAPALF